MRSTIVQRKGTLLSRLILGAALFGLTAATAQETYTYKTVGGLAIKADVYRPAGFSGPRPVLVLIHGGALMSGGRQSARNYPLKEAMLADGAVVVSFDYRLAPETKLPELIADVVDAFHWIHEQGPKLFNADISRIAVGGQSAGGYLALLAGYYIKPRPRVVVSYWGYGDLIGAWQSVPSSFPRHQRVMMSKEDAYRQVSGPPIANKADRKGDNDAFYQYCRRNGLWPQAVSGWDPKTEPEKFYPYMPVRNVTADYPPTLMVHGLKDTDVPCENSIRMAAEFEKHGVEHRLILDPNSDHGDNWSPEAAAAAHQAAFEFIHDHLK